MKNLTKLAAAGVVAMAGFTPTGAAALNLTHEGPSIAGSVLADNYPLVNTSESGNEYAGPFEMAERDNGSVIDRFLAWCFELNSGLDFTSGATYTEGGVLDTAARGRVQSVFDANYDGGGLSSTFYTDRDKGAALQLAIWEAIYETTDSTLDLASGAFTSSTTGPSNTVGNLADGYLSAANSYTGPREWVITEFKHDGSAQDIGTVNAIPLPAAAWLLMFASGGLLAAKRRSARRAA